MLLNKEQVLKFLPHRDPFLFIDSVEKVDTSECAAQEIKLPKDLEGARAVAYFEVRDDLEILKGHFPGHPILPGVVQVEMIAQACAFVSLPLIGSLGDSNVETLLLSSDKAKFRKPVVPGDKLEIHVKLLHVRGLMASYEGQILCNGSPVAQAQLMAKITITKKD